MSVTRKEFEKLYSAELLPSSMQNYSIGDVWDWRGFLTQRLMFQGMNIADIFKNKDLKQKLSGIQLIDAMLPEVDLTSDIIVDASVDIPILKDIKIGNNLDIKSIVKFSYGKVTGKNILPCRPELDEALDNLKINDFLKYKKEIRNFEIVIGLFYASDVVLVVDKTVSDTGDLKLKIENAGLEFKANVSTSNQETITIKSTSNCPFAAQLITGRDL